MDVHIYSGALLISNRRRPQNLVDVQFSIPYCLGLTAVLGSAALLPVIGDALNRSDVEAIADKVTLHLDPELDMRFPCESLTRVVVTTASGRFESPVAAPRGEADAPFSWEELQQKFLVATRNAVTEGQQRDVLDAVNRLRDGDIDPLMNVIARPLRAVDSRIGSLAAPGDGGPMRQPSFPGVRPVEESVLLPLASTARKS